MDAAQARPESAHVPFRLHLSDHVWIRPEDPTHTQRRRGVPPAGDGAGASCSSGGAREGEGHGEDVSIFATHSWIRVLGTV